MIINMNGAKAPETPSPVLQEKTVTPETLPTVIGADEGYDGLSQVTVNPDAQLKAENIRSGKSIFGVTGTFIGEPQPAEQLPLDYYVSSWPTAGNDIIPIITLNNSANTQYTTKIPTYSPSQVGYQASLDSTAGVVKGFRAWATGGRVSMNYYNNRFVPTDFVCDKVTLTEPAVIEPGEYTIMCPLNLFSSTNFTGSIAVLPVLQGNAGIMTIPTKDYEIIENVTGKTNGSFKVTTTKTFTIPANDYIVDRGSYFKATKIGFTFIPVEINQVTS